MWQNVTEGDATGGLEKGTPSLEQMQKCQRWLNKKGRGDQATCEGPIATHGVWNVARLHKDKTPQLCSRCGKETETLRHRFWECCENKKINSEDVTKSQRLRTSEETMGEQGVVLLEWRSTTTQPQTRTTQSNQRRRSQSDSGSRLR